MTDLIVQAHTGSGKTGAFGIPIAEAIDTEQSVCQALVLAPTRELANQVADEVAALGRHRGVRTVPIYGGVGYQQQIERISQLPKSQQRFVMQMRDTVIAQASR